MGPTMYVSVRIVPFLGEQVILADSEASDDPIPEGFVGVYGTELRPEDTEGGALRRTLAPLGQRGSAVSMWFVDRHILTAHPDVPCSNELVLVFTCDFTGYFRGVVAKPDDLPKNLYVGHSEIIRLAVAWRRRRESLRARLEGVIKEVDGFKENRNP
jgi:hypothetical protein